MVAETPRPRDPPHLFREGARREHWYGAASRRRARPMNAVHPYKLASVLLQYPTVAMFDGLADLDAAAAGASPKASREAFARFLGWLRATPPTEVAQHYVATFDLRRRCALYLTYYRFGDTRRRGMAMLELKAAYRAAGFVPSAAELPDYLPLVLDFAALAPRGETLLRRHRADLELLRRALAENHTPYVDLVAAVCARLPRPGRRDLAVIRRAWDSGPPAEEVGLEPFAPPEYMSGRSEP
ncbi:MAG: nitrate reductase molybdenum cofactor assembly chaperone [Streptosporangiaceae bacterium]